MSAVLHRKPGAPPLTVANADGLWVTDTDGRRYLDAVSGGAAVSALGHRDARVRDALIRQIDAISYAHSSFFTSEPAEELAAHIVGKAPAPLSKVVFCTGGSEAVETALKLARQYWIERGEPGRGKVIARRQSYHGATLGALSVGGNLPRRALYEPLLFDAELIAPCYAYRDRRDGETDREYGRRAAAELEAAITRAGPETVAAFIAEPVVGATLGCAPAVEGYLQEIRSICDRYGVLLILDEVMCGSGRTGHDFAFTEDGVVPDLVTMAKGLGGGFVPMGAVVLSDRIADAIEAGSGALAHGFTYMGHPLGCAAALAVQRAIEADGLVASAAEKGAALRRLLEDRFGQHPHIGDIRGRGLFLGLELVADRESKEPFDPGLKLHAVIKAAAMDNGLMVYPSGGTVDGKVGDHVLLAPALTAREEELAEIVERLAKSLDDALERVN